MRGGVPSPLVLADLSGVHQGMPGDRVDQARLARARGSQQDPGRAGQQSGGERVQPLAGVGAHGVHVGAGADRLDQFDDLGEALPGQFGLGDGDDRSGAAGPDQAEEAFQAPHVGALVGGLADEDVVDVGGQDLVVGVLGHALADECAGAFEDGLDEPVVAGAADGDPVTAARGGGGVGVRGPADRGGEGGVVDAREADLGAAPARRGDAGGQQDVFAGQRDGVEGGFDPAVPAEGDQWVGRGGRCAVCTHDRLSGRRAAGPREGVRQGSRTIGKTGVGPLAKSVMARSSPSSSAVVRAHGVRARRS